MERSNEINYVPSEPKLKEDWSRFFKVRPCATRTAQQPVRAEHR